MANGENSDKKKTGKITKNQKERKDLEKDIKID